PNVLDHDAVADRRDLIGRDSGKWNLLTCADTADLVRARDAGQCPYQVQHVIAVKADDRKACDLTLRQNVAHRRTGRSQKRLAGYRHLNGGCSLSQLESEVVPVLLEAES